MTGNVKVILAAIVVSVALIAGLTVVLVIATGGGYHGNDPRVGTVWLDNSNSKRCDGTTLVYSIDRGGSTIPNSPECVR